MIRRTVLLSLLSLFVSTVCIAEGPDYQSVIKQCQKLYNKKQYSEALAGLETISEGDSMLYERTMLRSLCFVHLEDGEAVTETYLTNLEVRADTVDVVKFYRDLRDVLSTTNRDTYDALPAEQLRDRLLSYWRARDYDPFTPANEYLVEHLRRLDFVKMFYSAPNSAGYDDRGKIYLKHGSPTEFTARTGELVPGANGTIYTVPFETWQYLTPQGHHIFHFFDMFANGIYTLETDLIYLTQSVSRKFNLGHFLEVASEVDPRYLSMLNADEETLSMLLTEELHQRELDYNIAETTDVPFNPPKVAAIEKPVDFLFDFYRYQSLRYPSMVDINIVVALPASEINFIENEAKYESEVEVGAVYFDEQWQQFAKYDQVKDYSFEKQPKDSHFLFQGFWTRVPPGQYNLAIKAITADSRKGQIYRMGFKVESFRDSLLSISDIQIGERIPRGVRYNQDEDRIPLVANPFHVFDKEKPLRIFFEIYNLDADINNRSQYAVMYAVRSLDARKESIISLRQEYEGEPKIERVVLDINIAKLPKGDTKLTVMIEDLVSGETVERDYEFEIMK